MMRRIIGFAFLLFIELSILANVKYVGYSFVQNYKKETYSGGTQIWSIDQDTTGRMYFANNSGLLTFDGNFWELYPVPNLSIVRSIKVGEKGRIYVGAATEFGYFLANSNGQLQYTSLINRIPVEYRNFGEVWGIWEYDGGIVFNSFNAMFLYKNETIEVLSFSRNLHFTYQLNNALYSREIGRGIVKLNHKNFELIEGGEYFANITLSAILPFSDHELMVVTREQGIYLLSNKGIVPFNSELQEFFRTNQIFTATQINTNYFVFGTVQDGLVIVDRNGQMVQHLNRTHGLQNNTILSVFIDHSQNLWLGLDNGIDHVLTNSPLTHFASQSAVGAGYSILLKNNDLYLGTNQGLFHSQWPIKPTMTSANTIFKLVPNSQGQVWCLRNIENHVFIGHDKASFVVKGTDLQKITTNEGGWNISVVPEHPGYAIAGTYSGLILYKIESNTLKFIRVIAGFSESSKQMEFDNFGFIWIGHGYRGVFRLKLGNNLDSITEIRHFSKNSGLPSNYQLNLLKLNDRVIVFSNEGVFAFNYTTNQFVKDKGISNLFSGMNVHTLLNDANGNKWFFANNSMGILKPNYDGTFNIETIPFIPLKNSFIQSYESVISIDYENILIATEEGIIHFNPSYKKNYAEPYTILVTQVDLLPDSTIYSGYLKADKYTGTKATVKFKYNALRFKYSALFYEFPEKSEYSYRLNGFNDQWSDWNSGTEKEYTNLPEGNYAFYVKARNIYGVLSEASAFEFTVLPPWYRSIFAYILYGFFFLCLIVLIVLVVIRRFEKERNELKTKRINDLKAKELAFAAESLKAEQEIIQLRNDKLEADNQRTHIDLESKNRELASIAMQITYKNELLTQVKLKLARVTQTMIHKESKIQVENLIRTLEKDIVRDDDWEKFEIHFDQIHEDFIKKLRKSFHELTPRDLKLCAYLRMNLSSKEIAPLLNISIRGVEISRYRLRKKMYLSREANLTDFLMNIA